MSRAFDAIMSKGVIFISYPTYSFFDHLVSLLVYDHVLSAVVICYNNITWTINFLACQDST
jgi:hypothetical protein